MPRLCHEPCAGCSADAHKLRAEVADLLSGARSKGYVATVVKSSSCTRQWPHLRRGSGGCGIVAGCRNGVLVVWHVDPDDLTGKPVRIGASIAGGVTALACSPGGQRDDGLCEVHSCAVHRLCDVTEGLCFAAVLCEGA